MTYSTQTNHLAARASLEKAVEEAVLVLRSSPRSKPVKMIGGGSESLWYPATDPVARAAKILLAAAQSADLLLEHAVENSEHVFELNGVAA